MTISSFKCFFMVYIYFLEIIYYLLKPKQHKMNENPYVHSGNVGQKSEAQAWQSENKPVGYTEQQIYDARLVYERQRARDCAAAMN